MGNEERKMKREKIKKPPFLFYPLCLLLIVLCSLLIACPDPFDVFHGNSFAAPPGMGAFSLTVSGGGSRTIMPSSPSVGDIAFLELIFTAASGGTDKTVEVDYNGSSALEPVFLVPGTYKLTVNGYKGPGKTNIVARGTLENIQVIEGQNVSASVRLKALLSDPDASGTFKWAITVPAGVSSASMTIKPLDAAGTALQTIPLSFTNGVATGSRTLNSGLYNVTFNLEKPDHALEWSELLHVYASLDSEFEKTFTDAHFSVSHYTVTIEFNNTKGNASVSVLHGGTISIDFPLEKTADAYLYENPVPDNIGFTFGGWYTDSALANEWGIDTPVIGNINLYAKWTGTHIDVSGQSGANDVEKAIAYVSANAAAGREYTLFVSADAGVGAQTINAANFNLTIQGHGGEKTITYTGAASSPLFNLINDAASLTLGNNITLEGQTNSTTSLVNVQGGTLTMSGSASVKSLSLNSASGENTKVTIAPGWSGSVGSLNLIGDGALWGGRTVLQGASGYTLTTADILRFTLGNFITGTIQPIDETHYIVESGNDIGKLVEDPFNLQAEVNRYGTESGDMTIPVPRNLILRANITVPAPLTPGAILTITSEGTTRTLSRGFNDPDWYSGLFIVPEGAKLVFGNIVVDGRKETYTSNKGSLVFVVGQFTLNDGAVLRNNVVASPGQGGAVSVSGSVINSSPNPAIFTMNGGEINGNTAGSGGGVSIVGGHYSGQAIITMTGGSIKGNTATENGGGMYLDEYATVTMTGGEISENTAQNGGGVFGVSGMGSMFIRGTAKVTGNSAAMDGGGLYGDVLKSGSNFFNVFFLSGTAEISGNTAGRNGGGVYVTRFLNIGGAAVVKYNTKNGAENNVYLQANYQDGAFIQTLASNNYFDIEAPSQGMYIGVRTAEDHNGIIMYDAPAGIESYFHADESDKDVVIHTDSSNRSRLIIVSDELFGFYEQVEAFATGGDKTIYVSENLGLYLRDVVIPSNLNAVLTITSANPASPRNLTNGVFKVPVGAKLIFHDIVIDGSVRIEGGEFTLKNGAVLRNSSGEGGVQVDGGTFTMTGGTISGHRSYMGGVNGWESLGGNGVVVNSGTFTMSGGTITENIPAGNNAAVNIGSGGSFTMSGSAKITKNFRNGSNANGVSISGTFTMEGGEISENHGYGVTINTNGSFNMSGGTVTRHDTGGIQTSENSSFIMTGGEISGNNGRGVGISGSFNMSGGEISGNKNGGLSINWLSTFVVGGTAMVSGNTASGAPSNVSGSIVIGNGTNGAPIPASGMNIGVSGSSSGGVIVQSGATADHLQYFNADNTNMTLALSGDRIIIVEVGHADAIVPGSTLAEKLTWVLTGSNVRSGGTYVIEVNADEAIGYRDISYNNLGNVTVTLRGIGAERIVSSTNNDSLGGELFYVGINANLILDSNITLQGTSGVTSALVSVGGSGTFEMRAGSKITGHNATFCGGVLVFGGTFTMNGGIISGNTATQSGGGVRVERGTFIMNGGTISGNTAASQGGGVYVNSDGTFRISNGTVYGSNGSNASLRNTAGQGAALYNDGTAQHGTLNGTTWNSGGTLSSADDTIIVVNGVLASTSIAQFSSLLNTLPPNTASTPYTLKLDIGDLGGDSIDPGSIGNMLKTAGIYVSLDLSDSIITNLPAMAFEQCTALTGITLPANLTSIGVDAFNSCSGLTAIVIPAGVMSIGNFAFQSCTNLVSVTFAGSAVSTTGFGSNVFPQGSGSSSGDNLKDAYIANGAGTYTRAANGDVWTKQ